MRAATAGAVAWRFRAAESRVPQPAPQTGGGTGLFHAGGDRRRGRLAVPLCGITGAPGLRAFVFAIVIGLVGGAAHAANVFEPRGFTSPEHEKRYHALIDELRCLVCQNQTIADSNADLASDLRREVYRMVEDGQSAEEIAGFMVARYGDFVLYRPPLRSGTVLLWAGPFLLVAAGLTVLAVHLRRRRRTPSTPIDEDARERLQRIIEARD